MTLFYLLILSFYLHIQPTLGIGESESRKITNI